MRWAQILALSDLLFECPPVFFLVLVLVLITTLLLTSLRPQTPSKSYLVHSLALTTRPNIMTYSNAAQLKVREGRTDA